MVKDGVFRSSPTLRLVVMAVLLFALNAPLTMMCGVVQERSQRREKMIDEVSSSWGHEQTLAGPLLMIPYQYSITDRSGATHAQVEYHYVLPDTLDVTGTLDPDQRGRSLFKTTVYTAHLKVTGRFAPVTFSAVRPQPDFINWDQAQLLLGVEDIRGIAGPIALHWDGRDAQFAAGAAPNALLGPVLQARADGMTGDRASAIPFEISLDVRGTRALRVFPAGTQTNVRLASRWPHPSFIGTSPVSPAIADSGFTAQWTLAGFVRGFPHEWNGSDVNDALKAQRTGASFGVALIEPVDVYVQTERAIKYAVLFIVMTFGIAFLWEITGGIVIHPIQYLFVGFGMCVFYLLLLSLGEHLGFDTAYAIATAATVSLLAWYWRWVLRARSRGALMGGTLTILYGYLYLLLRLEDYALLAGSIGLFVMLAVMMFLTRRVDWFNLRSGENGRAV